MIKESGGANGFAFPGGVAVGADLFFVAEVAVFDVGGALEGAVMADTLDGDAVGGGFVDFEVPFAFDGQDDLGEVEAVGAEVFDDAGVGVDFARFNAPVVR